MAKVLRFGVERESGKRVTTDLNLESDINPGAAVISITPSEVGGVAGFLPKEGYEGQVSLGSGTWAFFDGFLQPTSNIVFHELSECYYRTIEGRPRYNLGRKNRST